MLSQNGGFVWLKNPLQNKVDFRGCGFATVNSCCKLQGIFIVSDNGCKTPFYGKSEFSAIDCSAVSAKIIFLLLISAWMCSVVQNRFARRIILPNMQESGR
jgi:hypothetical protein